MHKITVIGHDNQTFDDPLIYDLEVESMDHDTVLSAFIEQREQDVGGRFDEDERAACGVYFAFKGPCEIAADYR